VLSFEVPRDPDCLGFDFLAGTVGSMKVRMFSSDSSALSLSWVVGRPGGEHRCSGKGWVVERSVGE
jgi:hypothetical protein